MMNAEYLEFLEILRVLELEKARGFIKNEKPHLGTLLEIGSGSGWQAKKLSGEGYSVEAIDLEDSDYVKHRVWPVRDYNGEDIPFQDAQFDIVFSSNVLEHIPHVVEFQKEIKRVLKPDGIAIHVLPSGSWRFWTNISYYPFGIGLVFKRIFSKLFLQKSGKDQKGAATSGEMLSEPPLRIGKLMHGLLPQRHGECGNTFTEIYYFSKARWVKLFQNAGWNIERYSTNNLFYTGYLIFGASISTDTRGLLSPLLGSSCHIFLLKKNSDKA